MNDLRYHMSFTVGGLFHSESLGIAALYLRAFLADKADVDRYLESMRNALLEKIRQGRRIQV